MIGMLTFAAVCLAMIVWLNKAHALQLADRYHEFPVMSGDSAGGGKMVVTRSDAGTFTVLIGDGKGACVIMAGDKAEFDNGT